MNLNQAIVIIAAMGAGLLAWNIWWLFFSNEAPFKIKTMGKEYTTTDNSRCELEQKLQLLKTKRDQLIAEVASDYNEHTLRQLNILDHHIRVTSDRVCGQWKVAPELAEYSILK